MEQLSACITDRMIDLSIINSDDKDCYCYSVQGLLEKITCLSLIIFCASIFHSLIGVLAFLSVYILIRRSSDGIHCKTTIGCFLRINGDGTFNYMGCKNHELCNMHRGGVLRDGSFVHSGNIQQPGSESYRKRAESP